MADRRLYWPNGRLGAYWNDTARTYTTWDSAGVQTSTRPYTAAENAAAAADAVLVAEDANRASIEVALSDALVEIQTIIDTANATINASPASYIKTLGRAQRRMIRLLIRRFDGTS